MIKSKNQIITMKYLLLLVCIFFIIIIFRWVDFLVKNHYLQSGTYLELFNGYINIDKDSSSSSSIPKSEEFTKSSYSINNRTDMPYFANYSCDNWCGPPSKCLYTREQCSRDVDCFGCRKLTAKNNKISLNISDLGQSFMNTKGFNPSPSPEDILENEYMHFSLYNKEN